MLLTKFWVSPLSLWLLFSEVASLSNVEAKDYYIQVKTGNRSLAGTDANIYLTIYGSEGTTAETRLNGLISGDAFERNSLDSLTLVDLADVGSLQSVSIRSDGSWFGADWYLSWVMVDDKQATFNRWIEGASSATADLYTVTLVPTLSPTTSPSQPIRIADGWDIIFNGNIANGPGSYYTNDGDITIIDPNINARADAANWVRKFNQENQDNPIVMWSILEGKLWAHREKFMYQNLDAATGQTPRTAVMQSVEYIESKVPPEEGVPVHVFTDDHWKIFTGYHTWTTVDYANIGIGPTAGHIIRETSVINELDAREWVQQQYTGNDNPIVMWEVRDNVLRYLQEDVMYRNLNADTGKSPMQYVISTKKFLQGRGVSNSLGLTVHVRNDEWWADLKSWNIVDNGDIGIGPGSYFLGQHDVSNINDNFENEADARAWVLRRYNDPNPIIMWQMKGNKLWYHREKYMDKLLSGDVEGSVWKTPEEYALHTQEFLAARGEQVGKVYVRSDVWWRELTSTTSPSVFTLSPTPSESDSPIVVILLVITAGIFMVAGVIYLAKKRGCGLFSSDKSNNEGGVNGQENNELHEFSTTVIATPIPIPVEAPLDSIIAAEMNTDHPSITAKLVSNGHLQVLRAR